jgi:predicted HTH transcriptional regulator
MKTIVFAFVLTLGIHPVRAGEVILPYSIFGPQVAAYELIGKEWWQWDSQGDDNDRNYPIKVVVFWEKTREETAERHPVNQEKLEDFRYIEYSKAITQMENTIKDFKTAKLDATDIKLALAELKKQKAESGS